MNLAKRNARIRGMREAGMSLDEIATRFGISPVRILQITDPETAKQTRANILAGASATWKTASALPVASPDGISLLDIASSTPNGTGSEPPSIEHAFASAQFCSETAKPNATRRLWNAGNPVAHSVKSPRNSAYAMHRSGGSSGSPETPHGKSGWREAGADSAANAEPRKVIRLVRPA